MNGTSSGSGLQARLQKRAEQDRQEIEALTQSELKKLAKNLRQSVNDEMYIIVRDIKDHTRWMNAALWRPWLRSVAVGVCPLSRHLGRELGPDAVAVQQTSKTSSRRRPCSRWRSKSNAAPSSGSRRRRGAWFSTRERKDGSSWSCPRGHSIIRPGPWAGGLPCRYRASEGAL